MKLQRLPTGEHSGKNYGEKMTRHQVLGLMRLKTNLHLDLGRAAAMLHELLAVYTQLPILHYFTLVVAHKQLRAESSSDWDLEELERVKSLLINSMLWRPRRGCQSLGRRSAGCSGPRWCICVKENGSRSTERRETGCWRKIERSY